MSEVEGEYCDRRVKEVSERTALVKRARTGRLVLILGLWAAGLLLALIIGTFAFSIFASPFTAIGASMILAASLRSIVQMIGLVAAPKRG